jgi:hypothetical protein
MTEDQATPSKNPGRVAWGKKLAMMSKELKEKKKGSNQTKIKLNDEKIEELLQKDIKIDTETKSTLDLHRIQVLVGIGGLIVAAAALYLNYKSVPSDPRSVRSVLEGPRKDQAGPSEQTVPQSKTCTWQSKLGPSRPEQYDYRNF